MAAAQHAEPEGQPKPVHIVKTALVIAKDEAGHDVYLYHGSVVPSNITDEEVSRLVDGEFLEEFVVPEEPAIAPGE